MANEQIKICFFGTSDFSAEILKTLQERFPVVLAVTQDDQPIGRKQILTATAVARMAAQLGIRCLKPASLKDPEIVRQITAVQPDLIVVVAYGKIIPKNILEIPKFGSINIHGSLLPKYRGASPIQAALLHGDSESGITIMLMDEQMDHGPILLMKPAAILPGDTFFELQKKLLAVAQAAILEAIPLYINGDLPEQQQDHGAASFCGMIKKEAGLIDWQNPAEQIFNCYRAYIKWPEIFTVWDGQNLKIKKCALADLENLNGSPGQVFELSGKIFVQCGQGSLELQEIQLAGSKPTAIQDFVRGRRNFVGARLGQ